MYVKQQQQIDGMATQLSAIKTVLDRVDRILSNPSEPAELGAGDMLSLSAPATHPTVPNDEVGDNDASSGLENELDDAASSSMPQHTHSAPAVTGQKKQSSKRRRIADHMGDTPLSKNTRAHSRR